MAIPDFTEAEQKLVSGLLLKRYAKFVPLQLADSELQLDASSRKLNLCPTLYWSERDAQFVVCKVADGRYRSLFFYSETEQYGTGRADYDNLEDCVVALLQVQSGHERQRENISARATQADTGSDYLGPLVV